MPFIQNLAEAAAKRARYRDLGISVGLCHGCFDIVHFGHIHHLKRARKKVDRLFVSVTADRYVDKGPDRPIFCDVTRAEVLAAIKYCSHSIISPAPTAEYIIKILSPDIYFKGPDYDDYNDPRFIRENESVDVAGGRIELTDRSVFDSSTRIANIIWKVK